MSPHDVTAEVAARVAAVTGSARMDLSLLAEAGLRRERALAEAKDALDDVVAELVRAGDDANIALAARLAGVSRDTLYARLGRQ